MKRIYLVGFMGSGKTTFGKILSDKLGLSFIDLDHYIENKHFKSVSQIFSEKGENSFRKIERDTLTEVSDIENILISVGGGTPCYFDNMQRMNDTGITFYLSFSTEALTNRLLMSQLNKRPLVANLSKEELHEFVSQKLSERKEFYQQAQHKITGNGMNDNEMITEIMEIIEKGIE